MGWDDGIGRGRLVLPGLGWWSGSEGVSRVLAGPCHHFAWTGVYFFFDTFGTGPLGDWDNGQGCLFGFVDGDHRRVTMDGLGGVEGSGRKGKWRGGFFFSSGLCFYLCRDLGALFLTRLVAWIPRCALRLALASSSVAFSLGCLSFGLWSSVCLSGCLLLLLGFTLAGWLSACLSVRLVLPLSISTHRLYCQSHSPSQCPFRATIGGWLSLPPSAGGGDPPALGPLHLSCPALPLPRPCHAWFCSCFAPIRMAVAPSHAPGPWPQQGQDAHLGVGSPTFPRGDRGLQKRGSARSRGRGSMRQTPWTAGRGAQRGGARGVG